MYNPCLMNKEVNFNGVRVPPFVNLFNNQVEICHSFTLNYIIQEEIYRKRFAAINEYFILSNERLLRYFLVFFNYYAINGGTPISSGDIICFQSYIHKELGIFYSHSMVAKSENIWIGANNYGIFQSLFSNNYNIYNTRSFINFQNMEIANKVVIIRGTPNRMIITTSPHNIKTYSFYVYRRV